MCQSDLTTGTCLFLCLPGSSDGAQVPQTLNSNDNTLFSIHGALSCSGLVSPHPTPPFPTRAWGGFLGVDQTAHVLPSQWEWTTA